MADGTVQQVKDKLSIVDVVGQYVKLERAGNTLRARCPFHAEKTPSFFVSADRGTYHCFGCNVGGDIFSFVEQVEGLDFKGALKILADRAGIPLVYERPEKKDERDRLFELMEAATIFYSSRLDDASKKYLQERGVLETTMHAFRIGWAGNAWTDASDYLKSKKFSENEILSAGIAKKNERGTLTDKFRNRIMFPIADSAGRVVAFSGRSFGEHASPEAPKYLNSPETPLFRKSRILYGFDRAKTAIRKANCAVLVEGQMDLILSHQAGWGNTLAVSGTAFTTEHAALIRRMTDNLVLALDGDQAGIKAAGRAAREALRGGLNVKVVQLPEGSDPAELIVSKGADAWRGMIREAKDIITFLLDVLEKYSVGPASAGGSGEVKQDKFRRSVEMVVLPFLTDVQSPIAKEQYVRQIAERLDVSQEAVLQALVRMPQESARHASSPAEDQKTNAQGSERAKHAYALLAWQKAMTKPQIDVEKYTRDLSLAIGEDVLAQFLQRAEEEQEAFRFSAERLYGTSRNISVDGFELLRILREDRLRRELAEVSRAQSKADRQGDTAEVTRLEERSMVLTTEIARLQGNV